MFSPFHENLIVQAPSEGFCPIAVAVRVCLDRLDSLGQVRKNLDFSVSQQSVKGQGAAEAGMTIFTGEQALNG